MKSRTLRQRGFTLIELLIVMMILSILTVVVTGTFSSSMRRGRDTRRKDDLRALSQALEAYYSDHVNSSGVNVYPTGTNGYIMGCGGTINNPGQCNWGGQFKDANNTLYMVLIPKDPLATQKYYYVSSGDSYKLYAMIENTLDQGDGVNQTGYTNTNCSAGAAKDCTYGIASTNTTP